MKLVSAAVLLLSTLHAIADEWATPPKSMDSKDGKLRLGIDSKNWRQSTLTLKRKSSNGWQTLWSTKKLDIPVEVYFDKDGKHVVFRDRWGTVGTGQVLTFLGPKGNALATYKLKDLLPEKEISRFMHTVSSLWWTRDLAIGMLSDGKSFGFITKYGTARKFDLATGKSVALTLEARKAMVWDLKGLKSPE